MSAPILATKLHIPPPRAGVVRRSRLMDRLDESLRTRLTLVSAPAGFGKTTLVSEWAAGNERPVAWLSLDEADSDLTRFLTYLVGALQTIAPNLGVDALGALHSPEPPPTESVLAALVNEIARAEGEFVLVLDDYHLIDAGPVDTALTFLLDHLPPRMHLLVATREDPQLPLARYRARGQMTELRAADLRFSPAEAAEFLNRVMGLNLSEVDLAALETRTEGWIAGLQLAALSMQGLPDPAGFIHSFTGTHRFVLDYLLEEVLHRQPEGIQNFLLRTSILERLSGPLCDAVLLDATPSGQDTLESLERANLFILPSDNDRQWYRYHHLFAELLRSRLARTDPGQLVPLHCRASDWFARNGFPTEAVTHALAVMDWSRAADVIERFSDQWPLLCGVGTLLGWLESFPPQMRLDRPALGLVYAWNLFMDNQLNRAELFLTELRPFVEAQPPLLGELFAIRVMIAAQRYDMPAVIEVAQTALSVIPPDEVSPRSRILLSLGVAHHEMGGDLAAAKNAFREAFEVGQALTQVSSVGNAPLPLTALAYLAEIEWLQGNLREASRRYEQAASLAAQWGGQSSIALCLVHWGRASVLYEWDDLEGAAVAVRESLRIAESWRNPRLLVPAYGLSALVMQARGQADEAREAMRRAELAAGDAQASLFVLGLLGVYDLGLMIARKDWDSLSRWQQHHDSEWPSQHSRMRAALATALTRAWIARYYHRHEAPALRQAQALLASAMERTQRQGLQFNTTRLLIAESLVLQAQGDSESAVKSLNRALRLAEPESYALSFLDLGKPMEDLLHQCLESQILSEPPLRRYVEKLLSRFDTVLPTQARPLGGDTLVEPLTERELEVLRLIAEGLSNREIAERLFLALSTVKGHTRIIFDKLQVQRRTEAVARARGLGLL